MAETIILIALDDDQETGRIRTILSEDERAYKLLFPATIPEFDEYLNNYNIDLIILDFSYQNGALADWLSLWPLPFIIFASPGEQQRLHDLIKDEASFFLMRDDSGTYLEILPLVIQKLFYYRELQTIQNKQIQLTERRYMELVQAIPDIVYHIDSEGNFLFVNDAVRHIGYEPIELVGKHFSVIVQPEDIETISRKAVLKQYEGKTTGRRNAPKLFDERRSGKRKTENLIIQLNRKYIDKDSNEFLGSVISYGSVNSSGFIFNRGDDSSIGTVGIIRDVTQIVVKEQMLKESNEEKTVLLREVHHRVKNNLQIILSLINLHMDDYTGGNALDLLRSIQTEIYSMALVHDQLYRSDTMSKIAMQEYLEQLIDRLVGTYGISISTLQTEINAHEISLPLDTSIPLGLIINEIVSHIFLIALESADISRSIIIEIGNEKDFFTVHINERRKDTAPADNIKELTEELQLAKLLVEQLNGEITIAYDKGITVRIKIHEKDLQQI